jgi:outer membrane protein OmpA-like peptidoglycan-associated protein
MKKLISILLVVSQVTISQNVAAQDQYPYYVVVGGFVKLDNAVRFTAFLNKNNYQAEYALNPDRQRYYVYILRTTNKKEAFALERKVKAETSMKDTWVYKGKLGQEPLPPIVSEEVQKPVEVVVAEEPVQVEQNEMPVDSSTQVSEQAPPVETPVEEPPKPKPAGKPFVFRLTSALTDSPITGNVKLQESERATQYRGYKGNEVVYVVPPNNRTGRWTAVVHVIGYREYKTTIDYANPLNSQGVTTGNEQETIIPVRLQRVKKGDFIEMDSVGFFNNSAILTPTSVHELDQIVELMNENQNYKIDIHGHVNGKEPREVITRGESADLFALNNSANKRYKATAKELSKERAIIVKDYLVSKGIDASRIAVTGDGYFGMIYPQKSTLAHLNDRVEIEITKD